MVNNNKMNALPAELALLSSLGVHVAVSVLHAKVSFVGSWVIMALLT